MTPMPRPNGPSPVTLHDVAREAGVSLATASRAINGSTRRVRDDYRARVLAAAKRLNYKPNYAAQAVARGTTTTVGLLVGDVSDPYFSRIAAGVIEAADAAGLVVTMAATGRDSSRELDLVRTMAAQRPRIMIVAGSRLADNPDQPALIEELTAHATQERFVYYHSWQVGDLLIWDERATMHRGAGDYEPSERRVMLRTIVYPSDGVTTAM